MRKTKLNLIIDNILKLDLLLLKNHSNTKYINKIINMDYFITSLKQFVIVLKRYFKPHTHRIVILTRNKGQKLFIDQCIEEYELTYAIECVTHLMDASDETKVNMIIIVDNAIQSNFERFVKSSVEDRHYFMFNVSADYKKNIYGTYPILSEMDNIKKILFLLTIIKRTIKEDATNPKV